MATLERIFGDFRAHVEGKYGEAAQAEIAALTQSALTGVLQSFVDTTTTTAAAVVAVSTADDAAAAAAPPSMTTTSSTPSVEPTDVEQRIAVAIKALGVTSQLFQRFDSQRRGVISAVQFRTCIARLGLDLSHADMAAIVEKYGQPVAYTNLLAAIGVGGDAGDAATSGGVDDAASQQLLARVRQKAYEKSKSLYRLFQDWASIPHGTDNVTCGEATVTASALVNNLVKAAYIDAKDTETFVQLAMQAASRGVGGGGAGGGGDKSAAGAAAMLTYHDFLAFFLGREKAGLSIAMPLGEASGVANAAFDPKTTVFLDALLKIGNKNLRKQFKELDADVDGTVTIDEVCGFFETHGVNASLARSPPFAAHVASYARRNDASLIYAEFIALVTQREKATVAADIGAPVPLPANTSPAAALDAIRARVRETGVSLLTLFARHDTAGAGTVSEANFWQAISELGFEMAPDVTQALFAACAPVDGEIEYAPFALVVQFPNRAALQSSFGGADSRGKVGDLVRPAPGGESSIPLGAFAAMPDTETAGPSQRRHDYAAASAPSYHFAGKGMLDDSKAPRNTQTFASDSMSSLLDSDGTAAANADTAVTAYTSQIVRTQPIGGTSSFSLDPANMGGAAAPQASAAGTKAIGGVSHINFSNGVATETPAPAQNSDSTRFTHASTGVDHMNDGIGQQDVEASATPVAAKRMVSNNAGAATLSSGCVYEQPSKERKRHQQAPGGTSSLQLGDTAADLAALSLARPQTAPAATTLPGSDWAKMTALCDAVYNSGKLKTFFMDFRGAAPLLSLDQLVEGAKRRGCIESVDAKSIASIFTQVAGDAGGLSYSHFIRFLSLKEQSK
jgi:Ca2+-binding EF-hand superfamily protein